LNSEAAALPAPETVASTEKALLRDYAETILICVIFVIFSRAFVFQQSKIPSGSMMDTLLVGDYIMVNRFVFASRSFGWESKLLPMRDLRRGDIVVFKQPQTPEIDYIKRVVGLPGDVVELRGGRQLYVNGDPIDEPYVEPEYLPLSKSIGPTRVPLDHYFMMGDHRDQSSDSRVWGPVHQSLIKGRALLIWYSFDEQRGAQSFPNLSQRLKAWGYKARHFFTGTRWSRCFSLIH